VGAAAATAGPPRLTLRGFDPRLNRFLLAAGVFALGNSSDVFLILRARQLGLGTTAVVLGYVVYNLVYMLASYPAGVVSDRIGRRGIFVAGLLVFAAVYAGFAAADAAWQVWPLLAVYGLYIALTDGVGKALVTDLAPAGRRATALGVYGTITGIGILLASVAAGLAWDRLGVGVPFVVGAAAALASAALLLSPSGAVPASAA